MNTSARIRAINERELAKNTADNASWHAEYADTPYIYVGNLHEQIVDKDVLTIFSQYGNPTHINMVKNEKGGSRGFAYLKYEDYRSCVLAVDNLNGVEVFKRPLRVDHTYFKLRDGQHEDDFRVEYPELKELENGAEPETEQKLLPYSEGLLPLDQQTTADDDDFSDPMAKRVKRV